MKFDRSDQDPLSPSVPLSRSPQPSTAPTVSSHLALVVTRSQPRELQNGVGTLIPRVSAPSGVPHGHRRAPSLTHRCTPSLPLPLSRGAPHFIRFSFICYLPAVAATAAAGYAPSGASAEAGLLSSNPTPFYKYITRPSGPLPCLTPGLTVSYRYPIVTLRCVGDGT